MKGKNRRFAAAVFLLAALLSGCGSPEGNPLEAAELPVGKAPEIQNAAESAQTTPPAEGEDSLPDGTPAPENFFADAVFIGDSRSVGLQLYSGIESTFYCATGMNVKSALKSCGFPGVEDGEATLEQLMTENQFGKIYISLGVNELGWVYPETFIEKYGQLLDRLRALQPEAALYIQALIPVTAERSKRDEVFNNERIALYNRLIVEMAVEKGIALLTPGDALVGEDGALPADASVDGIHLTGAYCNKWAEYLRRNSGGGSAPDATASASSEGAAAADAGGTERDGGAQEGNREESGEKTE